MGPQAGWRYALAGCLAWLAVVTAVTLGGRIPALTVWGPTPASPRFDDGPIAPGSLVPLDPAFVARLLGSSAGLVGAPALDLAGPSFQPSRRGLFVDTAVASSHRVVVAHELTNDARRDPYVIGSVPFTARTDTRLAGREPGESRDCAGDGGTVWYAYTPERDRTLLASTTGSDYAAALAVFDDTQFVGCDVDASGDAKVTFRAESGRRYLFQVTGPLGGGKLTFNVDALDAVTRLGAHHSAWASGGPSMSADGTRIVFRSESGGLHLYDARRGRARALPLAWDDRAPDHDISHARISADGRRIVFSARATNLVPGDTNAEEDVFVYEIDDDIITRISVTSTGAEGHPNSPGVPKEADFRFAYPSQSMSADGRLVAFTSALQLDGPMPQCASVGSHHAAPYDPSVRRLVVPASHRSFDCRALYVHDRSKGSTVRIRTEEIGAVNPGAAILSPDGRHIAFVADTAPAGHRNVFVHDRVGGRFELVSVGASGEAANGHSTAAEYPRSIAMSADGRLIAFTSLASILVEGDVNGREDVFVRDRTTGRTAWLSRQQGPAPEAQADSWPVTVTMTDDGRFVAYDGPTSDPADASAYVAGCNIDNNPFRIVRVHDSARGTSVVLPVAPDGTRANGGSFGPELAPAGDSLVLMSWATNLDPSQREPCPDPSVDGVGMWVFLVDRDTRL
jgi:Tol biopolymer transport system component